MGDVRTVQARPPLALISRQTVPRCRPIRWPISASDSPPSMPTRISSRSAIVKALSRVLRCRTMTTPCARMRRRRVHAAMPALAAAFSTDSPRPSAAMAGRTVASGSGGRPMRASRRRTRPAARKRCRTVAFAMPVRAAASAKLAPSMTASSAAATTAGSNHGLLPTAISSTRSCRGHHLRPSPVCRRKSITLHAGLKPESDSLVETDTSILVPCAGESAWEAAVQRVSAGGVDPGGEAPRGRFGAVALGDRGGGVVGVSGPDGPQGKGAFW